MSTTLVSEIESVLVYPEGAEITRTATLEAGATQVSFDELPMSLQDGTVSLSLEGAESGVAASQLSVGLKTTGVLEKAKLTQELREAVLEQRRCEDNLRAEQHLLQAFESLPEASRPSNSFGQEPPPLQVAKLLEFQRFRQNQMQEICARISECKILCREANKKLQKLSQEEQKRAKEIEPQDLRKSVTILLSEPTNETAVKIRLRYRVEAARWAPAYSAKFHTESGGVEFAMRALVCQASEEDWDNVNLTLSTSLPTDIRECPELKSLKFGRAQSEPGRSFRPPPLGTKELFAGFDSVRAMKLAKPVPPPPPPAPAPRLESMTFGAADSVPEVLKSQWMSEGAGGAPPRDRAKKDKSELYDDAFIEEDFEDDCFQEESLISADFEEAPKLMRSAGPLKKRKAAPGGGPRQREITQVNTDDKLWDFGSLRLPGWNDFHRGELVYRESWHLYQETIEISHNVIVSAFNITAMLTNDCLGQSLPSGYARPRAVSGFDHRYQTAGTVSVPSDSQFHSLPVFQERLQSQTEFVVVPRESLDVFRSSTVENITCHGLCPGPVDISLGEDFLHTAPLPQVEPSAKFELGLGVCQAIKVSRQTKFEESSSGLMSQTTSLPHEVSYQVVNNLAQEVTVKIRDRLPEPHPEYKDDLKIEKGKDGGWIGFEEPDNPELTTGLQTSVRVAPGDSSEVALKYTISMPAKFEIVGGNRREARA